MNREDDEGTAIKSYGGYLFSLSLDVIHHQRSVYNILDLLGDVGGLFSMMMGLGNYLLMFVISITDETLYRYIQELVF